MRSCYEYQAAFWLVVGFAVRTIALNCSMREVEAVVPTVDRRCRPRGANMRSEMEEDGVNGNVEAMCSWNCETT